MREPSQPSAFPQENSQVISPKEHFRYLDSLRGWAALGVILIHGTLLSKQSGIPFVLGISGQRGVQLFYVISAFTLWHSLEIRPSRERHPLGNYFIRRFFRIAPLFYLAVIGNLLVNGLADLTPIQIFMGLAFLNGIDPSTINAVAIGGWSIAVETTFYAVLPLLFAFVKNLRQALFLLTGVFILGQVLSDACYRYFQKLLWSEYFYFYWFPIEFPIFCMGIAAYFFWKQYLRNRKFFFRQRISFALILGSILIFVSSLPISNAKLYWSSLAFIPLILGLSLHEWKFFVNPVTGFLGRISYSLYLTHFFCLIFIDKACRYVQETCHFHIDGTFVGWVLVFTSLLFSAVVLSTLTYFIVEKPGIRLGRYLIQRREKEPITARI